MRMPIFTRAVNAPQCLKTIFQQKGYDFRQADGGLFAITETSDLATLDEGFSIGGRNIDQYRRGMTNRTLVCPAAGSGLSVQ